MLAGLFGFRSARAREGVDGESGVFSKNASSLSAEDCGVMVSMPAGGGFLTESVDCAGVGFSEEMSNSGVGDGDRGAPPHWDMKERTEGFC